MKYYLNRGEQLILSLVFSTFLTGCLPNNTPDAITSPVATQSNQGKQPLMIEEQQNETYYSQSRTRTKR